MRLSCPNCEAQYEVPSDVIPPEGRDVQCSNCAQSWFVEHKAKPKAAVAQPRAAVVRPKVQKRAPYPPQERELADTPPADPPAAKPVAKDVQRVLQQEAAREVKARQADTSPDLEVQEDLGLETPVTPTPDYTPNVDAARSARLPDIEEINSTLAATPMPRREKMSAPPLREDHEPRRKLGFRLGFVLALLILAILAALYVFAPFITEYVPQLADQVNTYVFWVNDMRQWLFETTDGLLSDLKDAGTTPAN